MNSVDTKNTRIAWLLPVAWFYWQPTLSEFTKKYPNTVIFTALWPGYTIGYENCVNVQCIGTWKVISKKVEQAGYNSGLTYVSPSIIFPLIRYAPQVIYTNSFGIWTIIALALKLIYRWKVIIAYEGSAPGVDFVDKPCRIAIRRIMAYLADGLISNSQSGKNYIERYLTTNKSKVFSHPYEVPALKSLSQFSKFSSHIHNEIKLNHPIFLFVGRILKRKGLDTLLEACVELKQNSICNYTLLIIGEGEASNSLKDFCRDNEIESSISWLGSVDYNDIGNYFKLSDVFILPTIEDTWGVVIPEAMLLGKAVIASSGAGSSELVTDTRNGFIFQPRDSKSLSQKMRYFINSPEKARLFGEESLKIMNNFTPESASSFLGKVTDFVLTPKVK